MCSNDSVGESSLAVSEKRHRLNETSHDRKLEMLSNSGNVEMGSSFVC